MSPETWYREIPPSLGDDPWQTWIKALDFPHRHQPLEAQVEYDVEAAIERADDGDCRSGAVEGPRASADFFP